MGLVLVTLVLAVVVGWAFGGRLSQLERLPFRGLPLLGGAVLALFGGAMLTVAGLPARPTYGAGLALAGILALAFCVRSRAVHGLGLVGAGLLLNALVVTLNGGMPVSTAAAARAGADAGAAVADARHVPADAGTTLRPLADVLPLPLPLRPEVVSIGDVLVAAGLAQLVTTAMLRGRPGEPTGVPPGGPGPGAPLPYRRRRPGGRTAARSPAAAAAGAEPAGAAAAGVPAQPAADPPPRAGLSPGPLLVAERRGAMTVWRAADPVPTTPTASQGSNGIGAAPAGQARLGAQPRPEGEPLPRGGPT